MVFAALSWNLLHGRDFPPDADCARGGSGCAGRVEERATYVQVNRPLLDEFADQARRRCEWDVALLQEAPPRWLRPLAQAARAHGAIGADVAQLARADPRARSRTGTPT